MKLEEVIHAGKYMEKGRWLVCLLFSEGEGYRWYERREGDLNPTEVSAPTIARAVHRAKLNWKDQSFITYNCGVRFELPERDEHGCVALFQDMRRSYSSSGGTYFEEQLGQNCIVQNASKPAMELLELLKKEMT